MELDKSEARSQNGLQQKQTNSMPNGQSNGEIAANLNGVHKAKSADVNGDIEPVHQESMDSLKRCLQPFTYY